MLKTSLLAALLLSASAGAFAQSPAPATAAKTQAAPALTSEQKAQLQKENAQMAQNSLRIAQMVDQGQIGSVWDQASSVTKQTSKRADFVQQIGADRTKLGAPGTRKLAAITRTQSKGGPVPPGLYINVSYATQFAKVQKPVRELISFHLDTDRIWRVAGYTVR
ncbi:DUF4019 domain-containing protein [Rhodanobacter sp. Col0626]|uniref:DUF4019 domain-containing protein n=1 Tax=Rhodanobacter sp. Col0626 TaxID=3415679 RepID=UPI003CF49281